MSQQSIADKSQVIRQETQQHANTRGRVADVIDDINETKANKTDIDEVDGDLSAHLGDFNNPHNVTKSQVGLGNADNTSDLDKPISIAVQGALDAIATELVAQTEWNENQDNRLDQLEQHNIDQDSALGDRAKLDASNLTAGNVEQWRAKLNVPDNPDATITIGEVTADSSTAYLALHTSGANAVLIDGVVYSRTDAQTFPFTPVTTGQKILIIYAKPDAQVFHLAQGAESTEAVEPTYSGLFVARLLVTDEGIDIVEAVSGFREKSVDNFAIYSLAAGDRFLGIGSQMRLKVQSSGAIRIGGFYNEEGKVYNGCPISVRNDTPSPMEFYNAVDSSPEFIAINSADLPFSIKPGETANFAYRGAGIAEIVKTGGGGAELPPGTDGQIYVIDNSLPEKIKPSDRLTTVEANKQDKSLFSALVDKWIHYYDSATAKMQPIIKLVTGAINQLEFEGRMKIAALILPPNTNPNVANRLWSDGTYVYYDNNLAVPKRLGWSQSNVFTYTPTGNFTLSQVKTALEATGMIFNDAHIIVNLGSNNYTCSIDIGAANPDKLITIGKKGTGSLNFTSTRTLNSGPESLTILNSYNRNSLVKIDFGDTTDYILIRNV